MFRVPSIASAHIPHSPRDRHILFCKVDDPCYICLESFSSLGMRTRSGRVLRVQPGMVCEDCGSWICIQCTRRASYSNMRSVRALSRCGVCRSSQFIRNDTLALRNGVLRRIEPWSIRRPRTTRVHTPVIRHPPNDTRRVNRRRLTPFTVFDWICNGVQGLQSSSYSVISGLREKIRLCITYPLNWMQVSPRGSDGRVEFYQFIVDQFSWVAVLFHIIFVSLWAPITLSIYTGRVQLPGCAPRSDSQLQYVLYSPHSNTTPFSEPIAPLHTRVTGVANSFPSPDITSYAIVLIGIPAMHSCVDLSILYGGRVIRNVYIRWISSVAAFVFLMLTSSWAALLPIMNGATFCTATPNIRILAFSHFLSMSLFTVIRDTRYLLE